MKNILLVYLPFCTPASPPYSITNLHSFLKNNCKHNIEVLDLNLQFHSMKFPEYREYYHDITQWKDYEEKTLEFNRLTSKLYSENNKKVVENKKPELFDELLKKIKDKKPDIIAFSLVYSSQAFYAYALMKELKGFRCVIGGPAVNNKLISLADKAVADEIELLGYIEGKEKKSEELDMNTVPDFSIYDLDGYFTPKPVIPLKTSSTCYYKKCAFCSHFSKKHYYEFPLDLIKKTIIKSGQKQFFIIDDMVHVKRLLKIAETVKPLKVKLACQLKPTNEFDLETLKTLREAGLAMVIWGVESGNDRVLTKMNKGTNVADIERVLADSHAAGIKNGLYIMFGFPTETKEEFLETLAFLERNKENIDQLSVSVFGLQKDTIIYNDPKGFGIKKITEEERTVLEPKITYEVSEGLTQEEANILKRKHKRTIWKLNKYPRMMNFFREHMLCSI